MTSFSEILLAVFLLTDLLLAGTGRLRQAIRLVAVQGVGIGLIPILMFDWSSGAVPDWRLWSIASVNALVKGFALPVLLMFAARKSKATFELEPIIGYRLSQFLVFLLCAASFLAGKSLNLQGAAANGLAIPVAFTTIGTGLFLVCSRRKAITQVLGFLTFENGIAVFGSGLLIENELTVELGILLDVFVLVFVLGIAIYQINRTFSSIDVDKLNRLGDAHLLKR